MQELFDAYPTDAELLAAEPEDLAWPILCAVKRNPVHISGHNSCALIRERYNASEAVQAAFLEAWSWLEVSGLLTPKPMDSQRIWQVLSRRAMAIQTEEDFVTFKAQRQDIYHLLRPEIRDKVWTLFVKRDYETAIGRAFKEVEIAMRFKGGFATSDFGERLIKRFFQKFRLPGAEGDERDLPDEAHLFIGAFNLYRNPAVHQVPKIEDPAYAAEVLIIAGHFLGIVQLAESRA